MLLSLEDAEQFFRLHRSLMFFVNQRLQVIPEPVDTPDAYSGLPPETRIEVHQAFLEHLDLIDAYLVENPFGYDAEDLEIIGSWTHLQTAKFIVSRHLKKYSVFLTMEEPTVAFGVLALTESFEEVIGPYLPVMVETTLLPFKGRIVYDGLLTGFNVSFGSGYRRSFKKSYDEAKQRFGIVTSLPIAPEHHRRAEKQPKPGQRAAGTRKSGDKSTTTTKARRAHDEIVELTDAFCREHLDDEYGELCRKLAGVLARKRPSPIASGKAKSWASGIVRAVGWVNFLGDPSQPHHMKMTDVDEAIGVSEATGSAKSMAIRNLLKLRRLAPDWTLPSRMDDNPLIWLLEVNGLLTDIRRCPRDAQVVAFEQGLIPYIPADRQEK